MIWGLLGKQMNSCSFSSRRSDASNVHLVQTQLWLLWAVCIILFWLLIHLVGVWVQSPHSDRYFHLLIFFIPSLHPKLAFIIIKSASSLRDSPINVLSVRTHKTNIHWSGHVHSFNLVLEQLQTSNATVFQYLFAREFRLSTLGKTCLKMITNS